MNNKRVIFGKIYLLISTILWYVYKKKGDLKIVA